MRSSVLSTGSTLSTTQKGSMKVAQKGIPEWLLELYDPLDDMMTKRNDN